MSYFKNKKILVIGGSGFIGSNLSIELMEIGSKVTILDQVNPSRLKKFKNNIGFIVQRTLSEEFLENLFNNYQIIFNFASIKKNKSFHSKYPAEILNKNTLLNFKVLDAFVEVPGLKVEIKHDEFDYLVPTVVFTFTNKWTGLKRDEVLQSMEDENPRIFLWQLGNPDEVGVEPLNLDEEELDIVIEKLREKLIN